MIGSIGKGGAGGYHSIGMVGFVLVCAVWFCACTTAALHVRSVEDPRADDHGPGEYTYPSGRLHTRGSLDLRRLRLAQYSDRIEVRVYFGRKIPVAKARPLGPDIRTDLFLPTVDIYLDLAPGGSSQGLPGRRVAFAPHEGWETAMVLSPIASTIRGAFGAVDRPVYVAEGVRVQGRVLVARFPIKVLQGQSLDNVGVAVTVASSVLATTFRTQFKGKWPTAGVREVTSKSGRCGRWEESLDGSPCTLGGCAPCASHPRVMDVLWPKRGYQEALLSRYKEGRNAMIPMVYSRLRKQRKQARQHHVQWRVAQRKKRILSAQRKPPALIECRPGVLGEGLDARNKVVGTVTLLTVVGDGRVAIFRVIEGSPERMVSVKTPCGMP
jgi:hypothetical protein